MDKYSSRTLVTCWSVLILTDHSLINTATSLHHLPFYHFKWPTGIFNAHGWNVLCRQTLLSQNQSEQSFNSLSNLLSNYQIIKACFISNDVKPNRGRRSLWQYLFTNWHVKNITRVYFTHTSGCTLLNANKPWSMKLHHLQVGSGARCASWLLISIIVMVPALWFRNRVCSSHLRLFQSLLVPRKVCYSGFSFVHAAAITYSH